MIYEKQLLTELMEVFEENEKDVFTTAELVDALLRKNADWRYTSGGQAINTRWLALRLGSYNLKSIRTRVNGVQIRVYSTEEMKKAFANYLSVDEIEKTNDVAPSEVADLGNREFSVQWLKKKLASWNILTVRTRINHKSGATR